jgi:LPXTG-motif cell wall-anchored protein
MAPTPDPTARETVAAPTLPSTGGNAASLPKTGASSGVIALLGAGLLGVGGVTLLAGRRRPSVDTGADDIAS